MSTLSKNRPESHFSPPHSWSNDPCGAVFVPETREYLLCYQWHPGTTEQGNSAWGMAKSKNLITWVDCPPAICNGIETHYDHRGVYSGSIVSRLVHGRRVLYLFYTSISVLPLHWSLPYTEGCESQSVALSTDYGKTWQRHENNPLLKTSPIREATTGWRDPFVSTWESLSRLRNVPLTTSYMLLGSGEKKQGPRMLLYESHDLLEWKPLSTLLNGKQDAPIVPGSLLSFGRNFECGSFVTIGHKDYLICGIEEDSTLTNHHAARYTVWMSGALHLNLEGNPKFVIDSLGLLDHGIMYAAHLFRGPHDEILQLGWVDEEKNNMQEEQGWAGCLVHPRNIFQIRVPIPIVLPKDMSIWKVDGSSETMTTLGIKPASQTRILRSGSQHYTLSSLTKVRSKNFELKAKFTCLSGHEQLTFNVRQAPHDREVTRIVIELSPSTITIDRSASSLKNGNAASDSGSFELLNLGTAQRQHLEDLEVRIFVDNSIIEVYANDRFALSSRVYPSTQDATRVSCDFRSADGVAIPFDGSHVGFDCWEGLVGAWPRRRVVESEEICEKDERYVDRN